MNQWWGNSNAMHVMVVCCTGLSLVAVSNCVVFPNEG